jgi:hypothetical protein
MAPEHLARRGCTDFVPADPMLNNRLTLWGAVIVIVTTG